MDKTQPLAKKLPKSLLHHEHERVDNYYWMRDDERKNDEVLAHLKCGKCLL